MGKAVERSVAFGESSRPLSRLSATAPLSGEPRLSKNPGELERAAALSNFQSGPAACTAGTGRFLRRKIPFSREKSVSLQAPRSKNLRFLAETGEGWQWRGSLLPRPPACQFFYKLKPPAPPVDDCCVSKPSRAVETGSGKRAAGRPPPNKSPHEAVRRRFALPRAFEGLNHGKAQSGRLWPCRAADRRL